jgi:hypothetical protein
LSAIDIIVKLDSGQIGDVLERCRKVAVEYGPDKIEAISSGITTMTVPEVAIVEGDG